MALWALRVICGIRIEIKNLNVKNANGCVFASGHQSALETIALLVVIPDVKLVLRRTLLYIPFFGWGLAALRPIAIDRSANVSSIRKLSAKGAKALKDGRSVLIFPEGTRKPPLAPGRYMPGAASLAHHNQAPLIPIAHNSGLYWSKRSLLKKPGVVTFCFGEEIEKEKSIRATNEKLRKAIVTLQIELTK